LVVFVSTLLFANVLPVLPGLLLKITLFNTVHCDGKKSLEIVMKMLRVEKVGAHAAF